MEEQLVVFELAGESFGVEIGRVQEIIRMCTITLVPRAPEFVEGVINLRGRVIPVVDLRKRFGMGGGQTGKDGRIVVTDAGGHVIGMVVDGVSEVLKVPSDAVEPPPAVTRGVDSAFLRGIARLDERLVILLHLDRVLSGEEMTSLQEVA